MHFVFELNLASGKLLGRCSPRKQGVFPTYLGTASVLEHQQHDSVFLVIIHETLLRAS